MVEPLLLADALILLATAAIYGYVGAITSHRRVGGEGQLAIALFSTWWYALSAITVGSALGRVLAFAGALDLATWVTVTHLTFLALCIALWGLLYYLVYLFTGKRSWLLPVSLFYGALYIALVYVLVQAHPIGVTVTTAGTELVYRTPFANTPLGYGLTLLLLVPIILAAVGYARLFFQVDQPTQRYRIGLVSFTIVAWFGTTLGATLLDISGSTVWPIVSRVLSLVAALMIYAAYRPPGWVQRRWRIDPVERKSSGP